MRRQSIQRTALLFCAVVVMTLASAAQANTISHTLVNAGPPLAMGMGEPSLEQIAEPFMINMNIPAAPGVFPGWDLVGPPNELVFETTFDPFAGPIHKLLKNPNGENFQADDDPSNDVFVGGSGSSTFFVIVETIVVGPNSLPFTDWHERILTPGWEWFATESGFTPPGGSNTPILGDSVMIMGPDIWFFFDEPLVPGTVLEIIKGLQFVGNDGEFSDPMGMPPLETFDGMVEIIEWPTIPAPAALPAGLMLLGAMGVCRRRNPRGSTKLTEQHRT